MNELEIDYDISVNNMQNITESKGNFKVVDSNFYDWSSEKEVKMKILSDDNGKQIFSMKDGKFVLEVEDENMEIDYFYSENIEDLL